MYVYVTWVTVYVCDLQFIIYDEDLSSSGSSIFRQPSWSGSTKIEIYSRFTLIYKITKSLQYVLFHSVTTWENSIFWEETEKSFPQQSIPSCIKGVYRSWGICRSMYFQWFISFFYLYSRYYNIECWCKMLLL